MNRRRALQVLTGGVLAFSGCSALGGDGQTTDDESGPFSEGLTPEYSEDPTKASLRLTNDAEERVDFDVAVTKPDGDRQFSEIIAVDSGEDVVVHDALSLEQAGETTFVVNVSNYETSSAASETSVTLPQRDDQQEVVVTAQHPDSFGVTAGVMQSGTTPE